jgi:hypothetical protein
MEIEKYSFFKEKSFYNFFLNSSLIKRCIVLLIFVVLGGFAINNHEIWLDEAHHFLVGRDSNSFQDLISVCKNDSHPFLWNIMVWIVCKLTTDIHFTQLLNFSFSIFTVVLILWKAPFKFYQNVLLVFSYFIFFEYGVIARNYSVSIFLVFISTYYFSRYNYKTPILFALLGILANTHFFGFLYSFSLIILILIQFLKKEININKLELLSSLGIYFLFVLILIFQIKNSSGHMVFDVQNFPISQKLTKAYSISIKGLFHFQDLFSINRWNSNIFINHSKLLSLFIAFFAWLIPLFVFRDCRKIMLVTYLFFGSIALFTLFFPQVVAIRHCGFLFISIIANYWIYKTKFENKFVVQRLPEKVVNLLLVINFFALVIILAHDKKFQFSGGKSASNYINTYIAKGKYEVFGDNVSIAVYCVYSRSKAILANDFSESSFCKWKTKPFTLNDNQFIERAKLYSKKNNTSLILIRQEALNIELLKSEKNIQFLNSFTQNILTRENYFIYTLK